MKPTRLVTCLRAAYMGCMLLCGVYVLSQAPWTGRSYRPVPSHHDWDPDAGGLRRRGTFGLDRQVAPVWDPPRSSGGLDSSVRWPWEPVREGNLVELSLFGLAGRFALAAMVLGLLFGGTHHFAARRERDLLLQCAWSVALMLVIAGLGVIVLAVLSAGYAPESFYHAMIGAGLLVGLGLGVRSYLRASPTTRADADRGKDTANNDVPTATGKTGRARRPGAGVLWFTLGAIVSVLIAWTTFHTAGHFRGPVAGTSVLGTTVYANDQTLINNATGISVVAVGWITAVVLLRLRANRAFALAIGCGCTVMGIALAAWK